MTSPVEIIFECSIRSTLSSLSQLAGYAGESGARREKANLKGKVRERFNAKSKPLDKLTIGMHVWVQDPVSKKWTQSGRVIAIGERRSYDVQLGDGRIWTRNRKFLRPKVIRFEDELGDQVSSATRTRWTQRQGAGNSMEEQKGKVKAGSVRPVNELDIVSARRA